MRDAAGDHNESSVRQRLVAPVLRLLRNGATPERLAWSIAVGVMVGINPLLGSSTVAMLLLAWMLRLNQPASQIGVHTVYPLQLLLFLPLLHAGTIAFRTGELPLQRNQIFPLLRAHPLAFARFLWTWEWHALLIWLAGAALLTPPLAFALCRMLRHALHEPRVADA